MKKTSYILACGMIALTGSGMLSGCKGTSDYDNFVEMLKAQPAVIDTISSGSSYANYVQRFTDEAIAFDHKDIKLNETQQAEISELSHSIELALGAKYNELAQTPMILPDTIPVPE